MNGTLNRIVFGLGVLLGVGVGACPPLLRSGAGRRVGLGVAPVDSNPGNELVLVAGFVTDLKAINEIKIPADRAVINKMKYSGIFLIICLKSYQKLAKILAIVFSEIN